LKSALPLYYANLASGNDHRQFSGYSPSISGIFQGNGGLVGYGHSGDLYRLGILYESIIHPLTILSGLPSAGFGAHLTLDI